MKKSKKSIGVGMPQALYFQEFGQKIWDAFGEIPYHVGSSLTDKKWRDVDVRLILEDKVYESMGLGKPNNPHSNAKWVSLVQAFSLLGQKMTGLPIDFQIQQQTDANKNFSGPRSALFVINQNPHPPIIN